MLDYTRLGTKYTRVTMLGLCPISSLKVNESLQKSFDAEHASTASHTLAPDDPPKLEVKSTNKKKKKKLPVIYGYLPRVILSCFIYRQIDDFNSFNPSNQVLAFKLTSLIICGNNSVDKIGLKKRFFNHLDLPPPGNPTHALPFAIRTLYH